MSTYTLALMSSKDATGQPEFAMTLDPDNRIGSKVFANEKAFRDELTACGFIIDGVNNVVGMLTTQDYIRCQVQLSPESVKRLLTPDTTA